MKIVQLLPSISYGDAVGNDVVALYYALEKKGYQTAVYAENIDPRLKGRYIHPLKDMPDFENDDIIIYHLAIGTDLNYSLAGYHGRKIIIYHNITPAEFFEGYSSTSARLCREGREALAFLKDKVDYCIADSAYNKKELVDAGFRCRVDVLPILIPFEDYEKKPNERLISKYSGENYKNIVFTGRIAPNKKQEDVIAAFFAYQKYYNPKSRLFLVGSYGGMELYYQKLRAYADKLGGNEIYFTGHVKFDEILAYYKLADAFLCMSEHEGFCVPLVEAMYFQVPIVAYASSAVGDTLGGSGVLLRKKNALETGGMLHYLLTHDEIKDAVVGRQNKRLVDFSHDKVEKKFWEYLEHFLGDKQYER